MFDWKTILGIIAIILTLASYARYIRDVINKKTHPHVYSWFLWSFITLIAFSLQLSGHAGFGALVTLTVGILATIIFLLSFFQGGKRDIVLADKIFFVLATVALGLWLLAKQPVISTILITIVDLMTFFPTIRKSWNKPFSETLSFYAINDFRFILTILALQKYTIITSLYPVTWVFADALFVLMLFLRRKTIKNDLV